MTQNPNLVPTVIVDRNGKATTVHKKPNVPVKMTPFGKPVLPPAKPTDKMTGEEIANTIIKRITKAPPPEGYPQYGIRLDKEPRQKLLSTADDPAYLRRLHTLIEDLMGSGETAKYQMVIDMLNHTELDNKTQILLVCAHQDYLDKYPHELDAVANFGLFLIKEGVSEPDENGRLPALPEHLAARRHYRKQHGAAYGNYSNHPLHDYRKNRVYMAVVERHHDKLEKLLAYRELRGIHADSNGQDTFDEQDFQKYLEQGAVANGWL